MGREVLTAAVLTLFAFTTFVIALTFARKLASRRGQRRHRRLVDHCRAPVRACMFEGTPLPQPSKKPERAALIDVSLRYLVTLRGREADNLRAGLEAAGYVDEGLAGLRSRRRWKRATAAELLGRLRSPRAIDPLVCALDDPSEDVRTVAARSLASIGDPAAIPALAGALRDPSRWTVSLVAENLMVMGSQTVPSLIDLLGADEHNVRVAAVKILGEIRDPSATRAIVAILQREGDLNLRAQAAAAMGKLGGPHAADALRAALDDVAWQVRAQAAKALGRIGDPASAAVLSRVIHDQNWWVRANCADALANLGGAGKRHLKLLLASDDRYVRDQCRSALVLYGLDAERDAVPAIEATS